MHPYFKLLGHKCRDVVTGYEGIAECVSFDLYGCIQVALKPEIDKKKPADMPEGRWFDAKRLSAVSKKPVMAVPDFTLPEDGPADKPAFSSLPAR